MRNPRARLRPPSRPGVLSPPAPRWRRWARSDVGLPGPQTDPGLDFVEDDERLRAELLIAGIDPVETSPRRVRAVLDLTAGLDDLAELLAPLAQPLRVDAAVATERRDGELPGL